MTGRKPLETVLAEFRAAHGDYFDYAEFVYVNMATRGKIICPLHGAFWQTAAHHLRARTRHWSCTRRQTDGPSLAQMASQAGIPYGTAWGRRKAGHSAAKIVFNGARAENPRRGIAVTVAGVTYPNIKEAVRVLAPPASSRLITKWMHQGMSAEEAFRRTPNPRLLHGIIYVITHEATGKQYVGLTFQTVERRWWDHISSRVLKKASRETSLQAALREYGAEAFTMTQVDEAQGRAELGRKEQAWITALGTMAPDGYNLRPGGGTGGNYGKRTVVDAHTFPSVKEAAAYVAETRGISLIAATWRVKAHRVDVPARPIPTTVYGREFASRRKAAEYVAAQLHITVATAIDRMLRGIIPSTAARVPRAHTAADRPAMRQSLITPEQLTLL